MEIGELLVGLRLLTAAASAAAGGDEVAAIAVMFTDLELYRFEVRLRHAEQ